MYYLSSGGAPLPVEKVKMFEKKTGAMLLMAMVCLNQHQRPFLVRRSSQGNMEVLGFLFKVRLQE